MFSMQKKQKVFCPRWHAFWTCSERHFFHPKSTCLPILQFSKTLILWILLTGEHFWEEKNVFLKKSVKNVTFLLIFW